MHVRKIISASFFTIALLYTYLDSSVATWQVLLPLFLLGMLVVAEEWSDNWLYLTIAIQVLMLFYFDVLQSPFAWLIEHKIFFGVAVASTVLYIFVTTGIAIGITYQLLRLARKSR